MIGVDTAAILVTFALAMIGYAGLTATVMITLRDKMPLIFWRFVVLIIAGHVAMVWIFRYEWQFVLAVRNGYVGFAIFHLALLMILMSLLVGSGFAVLLVHGSFLVVSTGAIGAVFRYQAVTYYRFPVVICALIGGIGLLRFYFARRRRHRSS